jgi:predicted dehydrogenase
MKRRDFLKTAAAAVAAPTIIPASALGRNGRISPSNRITAAVIGCGSQCNGDVGIFNTPECQILAVCDPNKEGVGYMGGLSLGGREPFKRRVEDWYADQTRSGTYKGCAAYSDFRQIVERDDIDAVLVVTPDHWHVPISLACVESGKDVYCEKPLTLTIHEGKLLTEAVRKHSRIFQVGSQQRSAFEFRRACELVRNGRIGKLHTVVAGLPGGAGSLCNKEWTGGLDWGDLRSPAPVPEGLDYNMWLGPAPYRPYIPALAHANWRWNLDYSGGQLTDWGGHHPDIAQWGMGTERTGPIAIKNARGKFLSNDIWNTAREFYFECEYANGVTLIVDSSGCGVEFVGSDGWIAANRGWIKASSDEILKSPIGPDEIHLYKSVDHSANFRECIKTRRETIAPAEIGHRSISIAHLGNIAMQLGRKNLKWNPEQEIFPDDEMANRMLSRPQRKW